MIIRKEVKTALAVLFVLFVICAAAGGVLLWRALRDDSRDRARFGLRIVYDGGVLWREEAFGTVPAGESQARVHWGEASGAKLRLVAGGVLLSDLTLAPGEEKTLSFHLAQSAPLTVILWPEGGIATAFVADQGDLSLALEALASGGDLVCLAPVDMGDLSLCAPWRLFGDFVFSALTVDTEAQGRIVVAPDRAFCAAVTVYAPCCSVYFHDFTPAFDPSFTAYYLRVPTLNGKRAFDGAVPVGDASMLARLFDGTALPYLLPGDTVQVVGETRLSGDLDFAGLLSFDLKAPLTGDGVIRLSSREAGELRLSVDEGVEFSPATLSLDAPEARLTWTDGPDLAVLERLWNFAFYNGATPDLGGPGRAVPTLTLLSDGENLPEDVVFSVTGNTLTGVLPYGLSADLIATFPFSVSTPAGEAVPEGGAVRPGGIIITTDEQGLQRRYLTVFRRQAKNIPAVYLETEGGEEITSRAQYLSGLFSMDPGESAYQGVELTHIRVRGRGNSTWKWEKKPYKIHFDKPTSLFGLAAAEEWALLANYADKSLMRNHLALTMAATLSFDYVPTQVLVDLFLNGEYQGVYSLGEHLEAGEGRVEVNYDKNARDCGYFLEAGGVVSGVDVKGMDYFHAGLLKFVLIKFPDYNEMTAAQFNFIRDYLLKADEAVKAGEGWEEYLDTDTLVDWMIMTELSFNTDCSWRRSTYLTKDPGEKVKMATVWDFDLAFGNFSKDVPDYDVWVSTNEDDSYVGTTWSTYLLEDPVFQKAFKARWNEVRDALLTTALEEIDRCYESVLPSAEENFDRWPILGRKVAFERKDTNLYPTYASQIAYLKDFLINRAAWIDQAIEAW